MRPLPGFATIFGFLLGIGSTQAAAPAAVETFLTNHCVDCHGPDTAKAGLRLDTLPRDFAKADSFGTWTKIFDRVANGEMPPKKSEQPTAAKKSALTAWLRSTLHDTSLAKQQAEGRVMVRRLNRNEYENTLRDLLGVSVDVKNLLPDDSSAAGFDNVSSALEVSSVHLVRYQDAAEKAIDAAIPYRTLTPLKLRYTGKEYVDQLKGRGFAEMPGCYVLGDEAVMAMRPTSFHEIIFPFVFVPGDYRVRVSLRAFNTEKPLPVGLHHRDENDRGGEDTIDLFDAHPGEPRVVERVITMKKGERAKITAWTLPDVRAYKILQADPKYSREKAPSVAVGWVELEGPLQGVEPHKKLVGDMELKVRSLDKAEREKTRKPFLGGYRSDGDWRKDPLIVISKDPKVDAERLVRNFLPRAFRRPVSEDLASRYVRFAHERIDKGLPFDDVIRATFKAVLCSPHFFLLVEKPGKLDDHAIASRLSYFLWSTMPDEALLAAAAKGELSRPEGLRTQVERMLKDRRAKALTENFLGQWLELRKISETTPEPTLYGEHDAYLQWSMLAESEGFFEELLREDRSMLEFVHSDWSMLNERLAKHYGIPGVAGATMRKVPLPPESHRGGVLTQAAILKVTANGTTTSPIIRGKWVLERIAGQAVPPPPADVPAIEPDIRGATTVREQLAKHRSIESCAGCHAIIDPPGFALETFDPIGGWRDFYRATVKTKGGYVSLTNYPERRVNRGPDVEKGDVTPDGKRFAGIDEYKRILLEDKDGIARNVVRNLMIYATGADAQFADREEMERIVASLRSKNYGLRSAIHEIVQSRVFLNK